MILRRLEPEECSVDSMANGSIPRYYHIWMDIIFDITKALLSLKLPSSPLARIVQINILFRNTVILSQRQSQRTPINLYHSLFVYYGSCKRT